MGLNANKPIYKLEADKQDITAAIRGNLINITLVDNAKGDEADDLSFSVFYQDGKVALPPRGAILKFWLGYEETSLVYMGQFVVDSRELSPLQMTIKAQATPVNGSKAFGQLNTQRTRSLPAGITLGSLCQLIASTHKLSSKVTSPLATTPLGTVYQRHESDLHLLTRLSKDFNFRYKIANGTLIAYPADDATAGGTQALPTTILMPYDTKDWHWHDGGKTEGGTVIAKYRNVTTKASQEISAGQNEPIRRLKRVYPSQLQASTAVNAQLTSNKKAQTTLTLELEGNPALIAEGKITLKNFPAGINRTYIAQKVTHTLDGAGYHTQVEAY